MDDDTWRKWRRFLSGNTVHIEVPVEPVSLQTSRARKDVVTNAIREAINDYDFILTGDIRITIEWFLNEQLRYETDKAADTDNIIKPILDGLCGPQGILIDDCQIQSITCYWIDWIREDHKVVIQIELLPDEWLLKEGLQFVHFGENLYLPISTRNILGKPLFILIKSLRQSFKVYRKVLSMGMEYGQARMVASCQRFYHKSYILEFPYCDIKQLYSTIRPLLRNKQ